MPGILENIERVNSRIAAACERAGRAIEEVKLVIVTKNASVEEIKEVVRLGYTELGESRAQRLGDISAEVGESLADSPKGCELSKRINWHMIGHLQRNKVRHILPIVSTIHSVDTLRLAEETSLAGQKLDIYSDVLLQVNFSGEVQKFGVPVGAALHLAEQIVTLPNLNLKGLMTMAPFTEEKEVIRLCFVRAKELFDEMRQERMTGAEFVNLSMGMSNDFEIAIEEGATMVRIGSAIFSKQPV